MFWMQSKHCQFEMVFFIEIEIEQFLVHLLFRTFFKITLPDNHVWYTAHAIHIMCCFKVSLVGCVIRYSSHLDVEECSDSVP